MNLHSGQKRVLQYKTLIKGEVVVGMGAQLELNNTKFEQCKGRVGAATLVASNCTIYSYETVFIGCEAPPSYAIVMLKEMNISAEAQIGQFEQCELINSKINQWRSCLKNHF